MSHEREPRFVEQVKASRTMENAKYKETLRRFVEFENLSFFPFAEFPVDEKLKYVEELSDQRVLTFAANGIWSEADLDELCGRKIPYQEWILLQNLERCWLHSSYQFQDAMNQFNLCPRGRYLIEASRKTALLQNDEIRRIEETVLSGHNAGQDEYRRTRYIAYFVNHERTFLDAMFARNLFAHDKGKSFFDKVEEYLDNRSPLGTEPLKENALKLSLLDALEYGVESLKWKYKVDEEQWIFDDVVSVTGQWAEQFKSPKLKGSGFSLAEINAIIKDLTGKTMTRTTSQHVRKLINRMEVENLAKFDVGSPIICLCLNNIIQSNHKILLPRQTRHNKRNTRKGSQEYSVQKYIKSWIALGEDVEGERCEESSKKLTRQEAPFSYNKIHTWLLQYIVYSNAIYLGIENEYTVSKRLQFRLYRQFVNAFRYYNYEKAIESISKMVSDIYRIFCDGYIEVFFSFCDQYGVREVLRQVEEQERRHQLGR